MNIFNMLENLDSFERLIKGINNNEHTHISNIVGSQKSHLIRAINLNNNKNSFIISGDEKSAKEMKEDLEFFYTHEYDILNYPKKDILFYSSDVHSLDITVERFKIINKLLKNEPFVIISSVEALLDKITPKRVFEPSIFKVSVGMTIERSELISKLVKLGYERVDSVDSVGQFSVRGGIIDLFSISTQNAVRLEYFDNEIDSIRILDSFSQKSIDKVDSIEIFPAREVLFDEKTIEDATDKIQKEYDKTYNSFIKKGLREEAENLSYAFSSVSSDIKNGLVSNGIEKFISYFYDDTTILLDYVDKNNTIIYLDEPVRIKSHFEREFELFSDSMKSKILRGMMLPNMMNSVVNYHDFIKKVSNFTTVSFSAIYSNFKDITFTENLDFNCSITPKYKNRIDLLIEDIKDFIKKDFTVVVLTGNKTSSEKLRYELLKEDISLNYNENINSPLEKSIVCAFRGSLNTGFIYKDLNLVVLSDKELFGISDKKKKRRKKSKGEILSSFSDLKIGDYVVHENHGIGIYNGIEKITSDGVEKEYLKLVYAKDGLLFVPITQLERVQKYIGGNEAKLKINSLSGKEWTNSKNKTKRAVELIAKELVELYAKRENSKGFQFSKDTSWQAEFEETFPYQETDDQMSAINDVKYDMETDKVMDRLICGDVGYGKTEIAMRAAFKAVNDGKQVAYLVPTTILANQHYNSFCQRMKDFPINIELLSRFRTKKQIDESISRLNSGYSDIAIGTHRLLSKDVTFKDLGLVIIDEEQRFGVTHKEKLKTLKENVDVLTLSATPIPRTLHMSLTGIRSISLLEEPPLERKPIQTFVMEYNDEFVKDAINRELQRNGQVFFLHNRVTNIESVANKVAELVPDASVAFAHGQMTPNQLEDIMSHFLEGEIDVLVSTTIIETGLDVRNANTIIINNADQMGLSQLYQLRGRVGRSERSAYCYLMYKKDKVLKEVSEKRLQTIKEFTEFGSGFKISMRDLEIRGAGSVLGEEQHGHMDLVGYDLYCKLLDIAIKTLKGDAVEEDFETKIELNISALIGDSYIKSEMQRLEIYKKISTFSKESDYDDIIDELIDRFGEPPIETINLLKIAHLKMIAHNSFITKISEKRKKSLASKNHLYDNLFDIDIIFTFKSDAEIDPIKLNELVKQNPNFKFTVAKEPFLTFSLGDNSNGLDIDKIIESAKEINGCIL